MVAAAIVALLIGVALVPLVRGRQPALALLDGFVLTALAGLIGVHIVPESVHQAGPLALLMVVAGLFLPRLLEGAERSHPDGHDEPLSIVLVASTGLLIHAFLDGGALAVDGAHAPSSGALTIGVILHRLPMGIVVGLLGSPNRRSIPWVVAGSITVATLAGYVAGIGTLPRLGVTGLALLQALAAGTLGHVVMDRGPKLDSATANHRVASALGALAGIAVTVGLLFVHNDHGPSMAMQAATTLVELLLESAPALLIAFVGAGILSATLRGGPLRWIARGSLPTQSLKGMAVGLPVPVCSCGVLPVYESLVRRGVPAAAALAFLVATPELGIDAVLISLPLLGGPLTLARLLAAGAIAWLTGILLGSWLSTPEAEDTAGPHDDRPVGQRIRSGIWWSVTELADHLLPWMGVGLLIASIASPMLGSEALLGLPSWAQVPAAVLIGLPVYVCASGSTPIAAVLLTKGLSPGAALAFLLAGPATNATTFGVLKQTYGTRGAVGFGLMVGGGAMAAGFLTDAVFASALLSTPTLTPPHEHSPFAWVSLALLTVLALTSLFRQGPRGWVGQLFGEHSHDHDHPHHDHDHHHHHHHHHHDHHHDHDHVSPGA